MRTSVSSGKAPETRAHFVRFLVVLVMLDVGLRRDLATVFRSGGDVLRLLNYRVVISIGGLLVVLISARARLIRLTIRLRYRRAFSYRTSTLNIPRF